MNLDAADLGLLWLDADKLEPLARDLVRDLVERLQEVTEDEMKARAALQEVTEDEMKARAALQALVTAVDDAASDAETSLQRATSVLLEIRGVDLPDEVHRKLDEVDDELIRIRTLCDEAKL